MLGCENMENIIKYIRRNKLMIIGIAALLAIILLLLFIKNTFFGGEEGAYYGNRLDGIENVKLSDSVQKDVEALFKEDGVSKVSVRLAGKIVEIALTVNADISSSAAKTYGEKALTVFSDSQKTYYDFQIFIQKENDSPEFPIIGYKQKNRGTISWTRDR